MKKIMFSLLGLALLALFVSVIVFLWKKDQAPPVVFQTISPEKMNIVNKTVATGSVVPRKEIELKPTVSGIVQELYVEPGDRVQVGDLIAKIRIIPDMVSLNNAESRVRRAQISLEDAQQAFDRQKGLFDQKVIPVADFLPFEVALKNAREELASAQDNLALVKEGATARSGQAANTIIRSTISGTVLDVPIEIGNSVIERNTFNDGTTVAVVADMGDMVFEGNVDETEVGKLSPGMNLRLSIGALENFDFDAKLEYISPKGTDVSGAIQFQIKASVVVPDTVFIRAGYSANADIVLDSRDSVLAISEGLLRFGEQDSVYVEVETEPQVFEKRLVQVGLSDGINIEVLGGIGPDDKLKGPPQEAEGQGGGPGGGMRRR